MKRTRQLNVLLSEREFEQIEELARWRGVNYSDVLRLLLRREHEASQVLTPLECDGALGRAVALAKKD